MGKTTIKFKWKNKMAKVYIGFASFGFLFNMLTVFALYLDMLFVARIILDLVAWQ